MRFANSVSLLLCMLMIAWLSSCTGTSGTHLVVFKNPPSVGADDAIASASRLDAPKQHVNATLKPGYEDAIVIGSLRILPIQIQNEEVQTWEGYSDVQSIEEDVPVSIFQSNIATQQDPGTWVSDRADIVCTLTTLTHPPIGS
jgi:hypothetical protein